MNHEDNNFSGLSCCVHTKSLFLSWSREDYVTALLYVSVRYHRSKTGAEGSSVKQRWDVDQHTVYGIFWAQRVTTKRLHNMEAKLFPASPSTTADLSSVNSNPGPVVVYMALLSG